MIYFDNAATGGFKINSVTSAVNTSLNYLLANPGRSGHRLSLAGAKTIYECRETLSRFFNCLPERVIFTKNCTEALNLAIFGSLKTGGHVITTVYEHNSVLRPLYALKSQGLIELDIVDELDENGLVLGIKKAIKPNTYLIVTTSVSNLTGFTLPIGEIGQIAKQFNLLYLVDGAQGAGHVALDMKTQNISMLALAGHKGLYGIMGSGALLVDQDTDLTPILYGGTGTDTFNQSQPNVYPERLEAGTLNLPAISALNEGAKHVSQNLNIFQSYLFSATEHLITELTKIPSITCYSQPNQSGIVAFKINGVDSMEIADRLNLEYDIAVRGGFHCAPLIHKKLGTDTSGLVRISLAVQNTYREINNFIKAIKSIAGD